ncbi:unnamed protein product [Rangifer tarandus platyrhynchus]
MLEAVAGTGEGAVGGRGGPLREAGEEDGDAACSREALEGRGHIRGAGSEGGVLSGYGCQVGTGKAQLLGASHKAAPCVCESLCSGLLTSGRMHQTSHVGSSPRSGRVAASRSAAPLGAGGWGSEDSPGCGLEPRSLRFLTYALPKGGGTAFTKPVLFHKQRARAPSIGERTDSSAGPCGAFSLDQSLPGPSLTCGAGLRPRRLSPV